jgi:hypothetical protein
MRSTRSKRARIRRDTNLDGAVDLNDLNNVRNNFGCTLPEVCLGDTAPFDGDVDLDDLNAVRNHFGAAPASGAPVPEPQTAMLAIIGLVVAMATRRRARIELQ